jgi:hypothetical protein
MTTSTQQFRQQLLVELAAIPPEYLPFLLQIVRSFRESIVLKPAAASFQRGWQEAQGGETLPIKELWEDIDADGKITSAQ